MTDRKALRDTVRGTAQGLAHFAEFDLTSPWGRNRDGRALPQLGVFTPAFQIVDAAAGKRMVVVDLVVAIRRQEGDALEDMLDADAAALVPDLLLALEPLTQDVELQSGENDVPGIGEARVGTMMLKFRAVYLTDRPH